MTAEKLAEILENHKKWLNGEGGERADLRYSNLSGSDLSYSNLSYSNLSGSDLSYSNLSYSDLSGSDLSYSNLIGSNLIGSNLIGSNLSGSDLSYSNLSYSNLIGSNLIGSNLSYSNLSGSDLSQAKGLLDTVNFMEAHFERTDRGYIAYKTFGGNYEPPAEWKIEPESVIEETVNFDRCTSCGSGINVAPLEWVKRNYPKKKIWKCLIEWPWLVGVCVPYSTDGKIRCSRVRLLEVVSDG